MNTNGPMRARIADMGQTYMTNISKGRGMVESNEDLPLTAEKKQSSKAFGTRNLSLNPQRNMTLQQNERFKQTPNRRAPNSSSKKAMLTPRDQRANTTIK